ncbi:hypothetical protein HDU76_012424 [Blyttiomyces sp. JEL0837]|nr:hypothetical protein HDU76_012424 [Blyttiomyces sp. JEL0837]
MVKSKEMYRKLCALQPDLSNNTQFKKFLKSDELWQWVKEFSYTALVPISHEEIRQDLSTSFIHIALRHVWMSELALWWQHIDKLRIFTLACCFGHVELANSVLEHVCRNMYLKDICDYCFEKAADGGYVETIKFLVSLKKYVKIGSTEIKNGFAAALFYGYHDIAKILYESGNIYVESFITSSNDLWRQNSVLAAVRNGKIEIVKLLLGTKEFNSKRFVQVLVDMGGVDLRSIRQKALGKGHTDISRFLGEVLARSDVV